MPKFIFILTLNRKNFDSKFQESLRLKCLGCMALEVLFWWHNKTVLWKRVAFRGEVSGEAFRGFDKGGNGSGVGEGCQVWRESHPKFSRTFRP